MTVWISERISKFWRKNKARLAGYLGPAVHLGSVLPLLIGLGDLWRGKLGANPIQEATLRSGITALTLLILSLSITPIRQLLKWTQIGRLRRPLGLWAAFYAGIHFTIYIAIDYGFQWKELLANSLTNKFILLGFTAGTILLLLAVTSLNFLLKKMGKRWKQLHRLVYAVGILAALHFLLAVKPGVLRPWPYTVIIFALLAFRLPPVQARVKKAV